MVHSDAHFNLYTIRRYVSLISNLTVFSFLICCCISDTRVYMHAFLGANTACYFILYRFLLTFSKLHHYIAINTEKNVKMNTLVVNEQIKVHLPFLHNIAAVARSPQIIIIICLSVQIQKYTFVCVLENEHIHHTIKK